MARETFVVLITGANRSLGRALTVQYLRRPNTIVLAGAREPSSPSASSLHELPVASGSRVIVLQLDVTSEVVMQAGMESLKDHGIEKIDLVISNACLVQSRLEPLVSASIPEFEKMALTNGIGTLVLFQQTRPLLIRSKKPVFVNISTALGSFALVDEMKDQQLGLLSATKSLGHFVTRRLATEERETGITMFMVEPGLISTDGFHSVQSKETAEKLKDIAMTPEQSAEKVVATIDRGTQENSHAKHLNCEGGELPY